MNDTQANAILSKWSSNKFGGNTSNTNVGGGTPSVAGGTPNVGGNNAPTGGQQNQQFGQGFTGTVQKGSDFLRKIGLGVIPNGLGGLTSLIQGKGNIKQGDQAIQQNQNPFITSGEFNQNIKGDIGANVKNQALRDAAGMGSWLLAAFQPEIKAAALPEVIQSSNILRPLVTTLAPRAFQGMSIGALQELSQKGATDKSVKNSAIITGALNMILPGISKAFQSGISKWSLGAEGDTLPKLVNEVGDWISGSKDAIGKSLYNYTAPIRNEFDQIIANSVDKVSGEATTISSDTILNTLKSTGMVGNDRAIFDTLNIPYGDRRQVGQFISTNILGAFDDMASKFLQSAEGGSHTSEEALRMIQEGNVQLPLKFWYNFGNDTVGSLVNWDRVNRGQMLDTEMQIARDVRTKIVNTVMDASSNPDRARELQSLKQGATLLSKSLTRSSGGGDWLMRKAPIYGTELGITALTGHVAAFPLAFALTMGMGSPTVASSLISLFNQPATSMARRLLEAQMGSIFAIPSRDPNAQ